MNEKQQIKCTFYCCDGDHQRQLCGQPRRADANLVRGQGGSWVLQRGTHGPYSRSNSAVRSAIVCRKGDRWRLFLTCPWILQLAPQPFQQLCHLSVPAETRAPPVIDHPLGLSRQIFWMGSSNENGKWMRMRAEHLEHIGSVRVMF